MLVPTFTDPSGGSRSRHGDAALGEHRGDPVGELARRRPDRAGPRILQEPARVLAQA